MKGKEEKEGGTEGCGEDIWRSPGGGEGGGGGGVVFFFEQKTAYEIYQCDWSSDVCSSDLNQIIWQRITQKLYKTSPVCIGLDFIRFNFVNGQEG